MFTARRTTPPPPEAPTPAFGTLPRRRASLPSGDVAYLRHGSGPPLLLVHGIPTSCRLWEGMLGVLGEHYDCIAPDNLGLGESRPANAQVDLSSPGQADMLAELLDHLGIDEVALVCHDQGGAHGQQLLVRHPHRVSRVVFADVVCYDNWLVPAIAALGLLTRAPRLLAALGRTRALETVMNVAWPMPQTLVRTTSMDPALVADWVRALRGGGEDLATWRRYVTSQSSRWTMEAVPALRAWDRPAAVVWASEDAFLPVSWATRLADDLPTSGPPVLLSWAGHFYHAEIPQTAARTLVEVLGRD